MHKSSNSCTVDFFVLKLFPQLANGHIHYHYLQERVFTILYIYDSFNTFDDLIFLP
jgi:hypothetical protein